MSPLEAALDIASLGWPVFPCEHRQGPHAKAPLVPGPDKDEAGKPIERTGGLWRASTDPAQIRAWWRTRPNALIGVPMGQRSGVFVIDLDPVPKKGEPEPIEATLARLVEAVGQLPHGPVSETQSGGRHIWFRCPDDGEIPRNSAKRLANIDWRGDGGYVIVPPSVMDDGKAYRWLVSPRDVDFPEPPARLLDLMFRRGDFAAQKGGDVTRKLPETGFRGLPRVSVVPERAASKDPGEKAVQAYARAALDRAAKDVATAAPGTRGFTLNAAAFGLKGFVEAGALSEREVLAALQAAADACGLTSEDGPQERDAKIRRGLSASGGTDQRATLDRVRREAEGRAARRPPAATSMEDYGEVVSLADMRDAQGPATSPGGTEVTMGSVVDLGQARTKRARKPTVQKPDGGGVDTFDLDAMNERFAFVLLGSKAVVHMEQQGGPVDEQQRFLSLDAFHAWHANQFTGKGQDGVTTWSKKWLTSPKRRSFLGVEFYPDKDNAPGTEGYLNLWKGFSVVPSRERGSYAIFRDHVFNNVAYADPVIFAFIWGFFAHMLQRPRERLGVALVMRGKMGTGKSIVGEVMGSLIHRHYFMVDDPRYVTGQFNAHMATCLLLQADEAVWAGDKAAEGRLKGLITSPIQQIEAKGVDPIRLANYVRLVMTSNEDWVVPAGMDERRFCVLDVNPRCQQNHAYFAEMHAELDAGGRERLLADLLDYDLDQVDLRQIPRTGALLEQKIRSLASVESWWFERLRHGTITKKRDEWPTIVPKAELFEDYIEKSDVIGVRRKSSETEVAMKLAKLVPGLEPRRVSVDVRDSEGNLTTKRSWCYRLPPLHECRKAMEAAMQQPVPWPSDGENEPAGPYKAGDFE